MNLYQRLAAVMKECSYVQKDTKVSGYGGGYTAVSHDAVTAKVRAALLANGVIAPFTVLEHVENREEITGKNGTRTVFRCTVVGVTRFINIDEPSEVLEVRSVGTGEDSGDKAFGKAVSYTAKYTLLKGLLLETGDDTDKDASVGREQQPAAQAQTDKELSDLSTAVYRKIKAADPAAQTKIDKIWNDNQGNWKGCYDGLIKYAAANGIEC